jgi:hypothetical protein
MGLLNISYTSKFFGYDIFSLPKGQERAFISTYQLLGYMKQDSLVILSPNKPAAVYAKGKEGQSMVNQLPLVGSTSRLALEAISWYQTASHAFKNGELKN